MSKPTLPHDGEVLCALVLGYNEMVKQAKTDIDKVYFRAVRNLAHEKLSALGDGWHLSVDEPRVDVRGVLTDIRLEDLELERDAAIARAEKAEDELHAWKGRAEKAEAALAEAARLVPPCGCTDEDGACELCRLDACLTTCLRGAEKRASREADARALASGEVSREELRRENGALAFPSSEIDWDQIQSLGGTRRAGR